MLAAPPGGEFSGFPDLAIEVVHRHGVIDKLAVYAGFGVREVWRWEDDAIHVHELCDGAYRPRAASGLLPGIDLELIATFVRRGEHEPQVPLVRAYRQALRAAK